MGSVIISESLAFLSCRVCGTASTNKDQSLSVNHWIFLFCHVCGTASTNKDQSLSVNHWRFLSCYMCGTGSTNKDQSLSVNHWLFSLVMCVVQHLLTRISHYQ